MYLCTVSLMNTTGHWILFRLFHGIPRVAKIENMGRNDQNNGKREQKQLIIVPILLCKQENHPNGK